MTDLRHLGLKVAKYKCFGNTPAGFDQVLPFNIIIGRNNTGKSALLDLLQFIVTRQQNQMLYDQADVIIRGVTTSEVKAYVPMPAPEDKLIGRRIEWKLGPDGKNELYAIDDPTEVTPRITPEFWQAIARNKTNPFFGKHFARLGADRDITPEKAASPQIASNGSGATSTIHHFRSHITKSSHLVERDISTT